MLAGAVQGALRPSQTITWTNEDDSILDLTGATLTGSITSRWSGEKRAIAGTLTVTDAQAGGFRWDYAPADVAEAGDFLVQFVASFGTAPTPAKNKIGSWTVHPSL